MKRVCIVDNPLSPEQRKYVEVKSVTFYLATEFKAFPANARIYHDQIAESCDVTPYDRRSLKKLEKLEGDFIVVIYPQWIQFVYYAVVALTAALSIYTYMTMPKPAVQAAQSANNDLASRQNQARLNGRIPEIFGTVHSTPDLIAPPFTYYDSEYREIEECVMVISRGYFDIHYCRDDQTDVHDISGASVSVFDPHTNIIGKPIYQVGEEFKEAPTYAVKSKAINGQTTERPNDQKIESSDIYFEYPNLIKSRAAVNFSEMFVKDDSIGIYGADFGVEDVQWSGTTIFTSERKVIVNSPLDAGSVSDFKGVLLTGALIEVISEVLPSEEGDPPTYITTYKDLSGQYKAQSVEKTATQSGFQYTIAIADAMTVNSNWSFITKKETALAGVKINKNANSINLNGSFQVESVEQSVIKLKLPNQVNQDWAKLETLPRNSTIDQIASIRLDKLDTVWVGWHNLVMKECERLTFNFFFQNGLFYQDSKGGVWQAAMEVLIEYQRINDANQPIGPIYTTTKTISNKSKSAFGTTVNIDLQVKGSMRFRVARATPTKNDKTQDLCKIKDVYGSAKSDILNYGDVTVVRSKTVGTEGALSLKERKLNLLVTRKLPIDGTGDLVATRDAGQALIYLALDKKNGRRTEHEVDIEQIKAEIQSVKDYFGSEKAAEFCYTFDDTNLSFQEEAEMIASTAFCRSRRFGSKLRLALEKPQENAVLLFNHRNKAPQTETMTTSTVVEKAYDGIELEYSDPLDDARIKYRIWFDLKKEQAFEGDGANNPMTIKTSGIRNHEQAKTRAWREWNKLQYRRTTVKFDALDESNLLAEYDKILVANNTRLKTQDGDVEYVDGLILHLSQDVDMSEGEYKIFLQMSNGTVDMIPCTKVDAYQVALSRPPRMPLVTADDRTLHTTYQIVKAGDDKSNAFMMTEMSPNGRMLNTVTCVNYTDQYYEKDHSFF
ncbi:hypothetical protein EC844_12522 [Acinetobacter calcoaceticus]|uniref:Tip attachment protein J HDII-ins2 domain-containing protein n=1 Tax=Acinetobacter calcoaceticus TaxID=471 RepID=A0A4R1XEX6_ACICA|nr:hypothetical protein EC844_12522 [Acinetobacter calcoaceticus]